MLTIEPERRGTITLAASRATRNEPVRLTSMTCCQSLERVLEQRRHDRVAPALLTSTSTVPNARRSAATSAADAGFVETSVGTASASMPCSLAQLGGELLEQVGPARGDDDRRTRFGEAVRELLPQPVGGAGDDRHATLEAAPDH